MALAARIRNLRGQIGLGLALCAGLVWAENGQCAAQNTPLVSPELILFGIKAGGSDAVHFAKLYDVLMGPSHISYELRGLPLARLSAAVQELPNSCIGAASPEMAERTNTLWIGPYLETHLVLYQRTGLDRKVSELATIAGMKIGVVAGSLAERRLASAKVPADAVARDEQNLAKLDAGRIDYWLTNADYAGILARKANRPLPALALTLSSMGVGLACNKGLKPDLARQLKQSVSDFLTNHRHDWPALE